MKYYVNEEYCERFACTLDTFKEILKDEDLKEIELEEQKRDYGGEMWCRKNEEFPEQGYCGLGCQMYAPCNGKNGRCRHLENSFVGTGKTFLLTKSSLKEVKE